eukprot:GHRR01015026.1.p1 GENE.GHRR01015026.1~~GHRR01015026.1.p1  ORF type:complete len:136 (+),score=25.92 GHRR01015026.1:1453-1860(+)
MVRTCNTAVRKPVGYVKPPSQYSLGYVPSAHLASCSMRASRSLVQGPRGFRLGYVLSQAEGTLALYNASKICNVMRTTRAQPVQAHPSSATSSKQHRAGKHLLCFVSLQRILLVDMRKCVWHVAAAVKGLSRIRF